MNFASLFLLAGLHVAALAQLVPPSFSVPTTYSGEGYKLVPLGPEVAKLDYAAYMGSINHIRSTMGGKWPHAGLTLDDQAKDMAGEKAQWDARKSFPYAVLSPDGSAEYGCFYIRPSGKQGYDAVATLWVTKDQAEHGFDRKLAADMKSWLATGWPFTKVAWPGLDMPRDEWNALPAKTPKK